MDANERRARASADASAWWLQLQSGEMSRSEREDFVDWLRESLVHVTEILRIAQVHNALEQFERWTHINTEGSADESVVDFPHVAHDRAVMPAGSGGRSRRSSRIGLAAAIAASVLAVAVLLTSLAGQTIETERGERREVALSDGSVLQIDPETKLHVKLEEQARRVVLKHGRALFRVAKDPNRPFTVQVDDTIVRAVGTAFAVERKDQGVTVTVAEGKVAITSSSSGAAQPKAQLRESAPLLSANEQITVQRSGSAQAVRKVDSHRELAWSEGRLVFDNATLAAAVTDFNRYNRVQLRVADAALAARSISGVFDASDPESFIAFIQTVTHVSVVRDRGEGITIASAD